MSVEGEEELECVHEVDGDRRIEKTDLEILILLLLLLFLLLMLLLLQFIINSNIRYSRADRQLSIHETTPWNQATPNLIDRWGQFEFLKVLKKTQAWTIIAWSALEHKTNLQNSTAPRWLYQTKFEYYLTLLQYQHLTAHGSFQAITQIGETKAPQVCQIDQMHRNQSIPSYRNANLTHEWESPIVSCCIILP